MTELEQAYQDELERRIAEMEAPDYEFPEPFGKRDWILAAVAIVLSGASVLCGIWL